jgi:hypothetical protein
MQKEARRQRISLGLKPEHIRWLRENAQASGATMAQIINGLIASQTSKTGKKNRQKTTGMKNQ